MQHKTEATSSSSSPAATPLPIAEEDRCCVSCLRRSRSPPNCHCAPPSPLTPRVLEVLGSSKLLGLIYNVDAAYHSRSFDSSSCYLHHMFKYAPSIREQLQDWEDGLSESDADGSFLHEHRNSNLRLFSIDEAYNLLQFLLLRAESEIQRLLVDAAQTHRTLDLIKSQMKKVFYRHVESSQPKSLPEGEHNQHHGRGEVFTPKHPSSGESSLADAKHKGDWMMRPISDTEVGWLARILIRFSSWLNQARLYSYRDPWASAIL